ncbi:FkbM family methyltransferase [Actinomadura litoris]|uniref:FkbM family methyltransferase n=1 Tax=Actinomadura litoris TaxID=2678616 RepID=A0A7K1L7L6_9ACTN|nr:FkbM family methyltransferase [Actinomadura litoris]MUN40437.1 FkbM family methyltransferase [Actinomadura litoris]
MAAAPSLVECDGLTWTVRPGSGDRIGPGPHEQDIWRLLRSFAEPGSVFIDAGAHVGHFALRMAGAFATVVAIEPNPDALRTLRANIRLNGIGNIDVRPLAVYETRTTVRLWDPFNMPAGACTRSLATGEPARPPADCKISALYNGGDGYGAFLGEVEAVPIDLIASGVNGPIGFIKIDIEGHEGKALAGAAATVREHRPALLIEMHDPMYGAHIKDEVARELARHGYTWREFSLYQRSKLTDSDMCPYIYAEPVGAGRAQEFLDFAEHVNKDAASRWVTTP